jgi:hypothetical protein
MEVLMPSVRREPRSDPFGKGTDYAATLRAKWNAEWYLSIAFTTNPGGLNRSDFDVMIGPEEFKDLARAMIKVDPAAAIKAFCYAMQEAPKIPKPDRPSRNAVAA